MSVQAHERAGTGHAEAKVLAECKEKGLLAKIDTLYVTLEPCNHTGKTPPCTETILSSWVPKVVYGARDPNPLVTGGGARRLMDEGVKVERIADAELARECEELIEPFAWYALTGRPYVTVKTAHLPNLPWRESMIPPAGQKTFTSPESLKLAHQLRRESDAIVTGSGTVLADRPEFTVRHVPDHIGAKPRWLAVLDRRGQVPESWYAGAAARGFRISHGKNLEETIEFLGKQGVIHVLVEAGPTLSGEILATSIWNRHVVVTRTEGKDRVEVRHRRK